MLDAFPATLVPFFAAAFGAAWGMTGLVREYALRRHLVDVPNQRSSHTTPTPRGGGLAIVAVCVGAFVGLTLTGALDSPLALALTVPACLIAAVGWLDDHGHVAVPLRLVVQLGASASAVFLLGGFGTLDLGIYALHLGSVGHVLAILGLVWLTNLFNFMDGVDGLAGSEALVVAGVGGAMLLWAGADGLGAAALLTAAAAAGFLVWNWPPARIFMGDVGSGFLGFHLGVVALASDRAGVVPVAVWGLLLSVFLFDATVTLARRLGRERVHEAHRRHAYQRAVAAGLSHRAVTLSVLALNGAVVGLAVLAWLSPAVALYAIAAGLMLLSGAYIVVEHHRPMWTDPPRGAVRDT